MEGTGVWAQSKGFGKLLRYEENTGIWGYRARLLNAESKDVQEYAGILVKMLGFGNAGQGCCCLGQGFW